MKKLKYFTNASNGTYVALLNGEIGEEVNGRYLAEEIVYLNRYYKEEVNRIALHINSVGGSVVDALNIVSAMLSSEIPVDTYIDGLALSSAGWIAMSGKRRYMNDIARLMIHEPYSEEDPGNQSQALKNIREIIVGIIRNNSNREEAEISAIMSAETWLDAEDCLELGLIDEIVFTGREIAIESTNDAKAALAIYNKALNTSKLDMKKIANILKLKEDASEASIVESLENVVDAANKVAGLEKRVNDLQQTIDAKNAELAEIQDQKIADFVNAKIEAGILKNDEREALIDEAKEDLPRFERMVNRIEEASKVHFDLSKRVENKGNAIATPDKFKNKGFREIEKTEGGEKFLADLKNTAPDAWNKLYDAEYKSA